MVGQISIRQGHAEGGLRIAQRPNTKVSLHALFFKILLNPFHRIIQAAVGAVTRTQKSASASLPPAVLAQIHPLELRQSLLTAVDDVEHHVKDRRSSRP